VTGARRKGLLLLGAAVSAIFLLNLIPTLTLDTAPDYDRQMHLFMADHYRNDWFSPWEKRWFGGFSMFSYPPLAHQLLALLSRPFGLEGAYAILQLLILVAVPVVTWLWVAELIDVEAAGFAALLSVVTSSLYVLIYNYGMLAAVLAWVLMLTATSALLRYLRSGRRVALFAWSALGAATVAAHHFTSIVCLPVLALVTVAASLMQGVAWRSVVARGTMAAACMLITGTLVGLPFWWWLLTQSMPQTEIWHQSRISFFDDPGAFGVYQLSMWGGSLLIAPWVMWSGFRAPRTRLVTLFIVLLAVLGLGGTTRLPALLFGGWWLWLTYERFAFWGSMLFLAPAGMWLCRQRLRVIVSVMGVFLIAAVWAETRWQGDRILPQPLDRSVLTEMLNFLHNDGREQWYYMTLGLAESDLARLSRQTLAPTLDGLYHTARRDAFQRFSGVGPQDTIVWSRHPAGSFMQDVLLTHPQAFGVLLVFSRSKRGDAMLARAKWVNVGSFSPDGYREIGRDGPGLAQVRVWQAPHAERVKRVSALADQPPTPPILCLMWGVLPLLALGIGLGAYARCMLPYDVTASDVGVGEHGGP